MSRFLLAGVVASVSLAGLSFGQADPAVIARIIDEGKNNNQAEKTITHLTQEIGPRLTGSETKMKAKEWARDLMIEMGLQNVRLEEFMTIPVGFTRGPSSGRMIVGNTTRDFELTTQSWAPGTDGPVRGIVIREPVTESEFEAVQDQLEGAWILRRAIRPQGRRGVVADAQDSPEVVNLYDRLSEAGVAGFINPSTQGELVRTSAIRNWRSLDFDNLPSDVAVTVRRSDYDAINSRLFDGETVEVEFDLQHHFKRGPIPQYNVIGEIPGTEFPDEYVYISGHIDSWDGPGSQGAQDNGTGTTVALEAARILMASGAKPRRTIRIALWGAEEQGLIGSRAHVSMLPEEELSKISAVFVNDSGTNYQGGVAGTAAMVPYLSEAVAPVNEAFPEMQCRVRTIESMPRGGASDHAAFNARGVPGFFWQLVGDVSYRYSWHTQHDTLEFVRFDYLKQSSTCSASVAYYIAMMDRLLPRDGEEPVTAAE